MSDTRPRSYCVQFPESDYHFLSRRLAEEGLAWKVEEDKEAHEARYRTWLGRGTVRSLTVGTRIDLIGLPIAPQQPEVEHRYAPKEVPLGYAITEVTHVGINNLSGEANLRPLRRSRHAWRE